MNNKKNVSFRLSEPDIRRLKDVSAKLGIKDSELFRFSIKSVLNQFIPLLKEDLRGVEFLLAILEAGDDFLRYFEFDPYALEVVINQNLDEEKKVSITDIELVTVAMLNEEYLINQLRAAGFEFDEGSVFSAVELLKRYFKSKYCLDNLTASA